MHISFLIIHNAFITISLLFIIIFHIQFKELFFIVLLTFIILNLLINLLFDMISSLTIIFFAMTFFLIDFSFRPFLVKFGLDPYQEIFSFNYIHAINFT